MDIGKAIEETAKVMEKVRRLANAVDALREIAERTLPKLKIPKLGAAKNNKEVEKRYDEVVSELKAERAEHEKTRQYLNWATKEIENVKAAMRDWQRKALVRSSRQNRRRRSEAAVLTERQAREARRNRNRGH
jgi:hypothetical protein